MRSIIFAVIALLLLAAVAYIFLSHQWLSEEARIQRQIEKGRDAIEHKAVLVLASFISENYRGEIGKNRSDLLAEARQFFQLVDNLKVTIQSTQITVDGPEAEVIIEYRLSGILNGQPFSGIGQGERDAVQLRLSKKSGSWKVVEAIRMDH